MPQQQIAEGEYQEWLLHPVTKAMFARFREDRERLKEEWANGAFGNNPMRDSQARGQCEIISQFLALEVSDLENEGS